MVWSFFVLTELSSWLQSAAWAAACCCTTYVRVPATQSGMQFKPVVYSYIFIYMMSLPLYCVVAVRACGKK